MFPSILNQHSLSLSHSRLSLTKKGRKGFHILELFIAANDVETILQVVHDIIGYQCKLRLIL